MLYAAYGSNINSFKLTMRCKKARYYASGIIENYELQFRGKSSNAYATILKSNGTNVPVVLWELENSDEESLDKYEGYPTNYQKETVDVKLGDGSKIKAMAYVMDRNKQYGMPSLLYYRSILEGYKEFHLDENVLSNALGESAQNYYRIAVMELNEEIRRRFPEPP